ncbi:membrane protein [Enterococcus florum]|uniref:Membrane protein n=1 Tax=Enterococcus florum TaxID=2480627 RepID=A0A4P5P3H0_9ENTE|nr:membrane protein [Enterococcus florum]
MKKTTPHQLALMALAVALNIVLGNLALFLRLPIYLDAVGTMLSAAAFGPFAGILTGLSSALITGLTTDLFSLYFAPVQVCVGLMTGLLVYRQTFKGPLIIKALLITIPGTFIASLITVLLFGGITSSGSSMIVQILNGLGLNQTLSVFLVQLGTDYLDRFLALTLVVGALRIMPSYKKRVL